MDRKEEFAAQLYRNDLQTVNELLTNPEKESLKQFYYEHFDDIVELIAHCKSLRTVIGDFYVLDPNMKPELSQDNLFVYMVNVAIKDGILTKESFGLTQ